jgi:hypothetical protein
VLTRGNSDDLRSISFKTIFDNLPNLNLPPAIRHFWEWYFSLPEVKARYGGKRP